VYWLPIVQYGSYDNVVSCGSLSTDVARFGCLFDRRLRSDSVVLLKSHANVWSALLIVSMTFPAGNVEW
jgi:hypothetical protein